MTDPRQRVKEFLTWQNATSPFFLPKELLVRKSTPTVAPTAQFTPPMQGGDPEAAMALLARDTAGCMKCRLSETRTKLVFGVGDVRARLLFIGEGPGEDEDLQGIPFIGRAGQLLTKIIENGLKIPRDSVYIANIVKCRPPKNRAPFKDEADACIGYLKNQIAIVRPEAIVLLGKTALEHLLGHDKMTIRDAREKNFEFEGIRVFVTYHPSALLRSPDLKRPTWDDMKKVMAYLGLPVEG
ncbi:MAG TPA: uracil-DNA glycosylase [bacterium]|nr:uracil-DNA glycosylase [bacterium]